MSVLAAYTHSTYTPVANSVDSLLHRFTVRNSAGFVCGTVDLCAVMDGDEYLHADAELGNLLVLPQYRGRGVAERLMGLAVTHAACHSMALLLRVRPYGAGCRGVSKRRLRAYYATWGFKSTRADPYTMVLQW